MGMNTSGDFGVRVKAKNGRLLYYDKIEKKDIPVNNVTGYLQKVWTNVEKSPDEQFLFPTVYAKFVDASGEIVVVSFSQETLANVNFWQYLTAPGIDFSKELRIGASGTEQNEKITFLWLTYADGDKIVKNKSFPEPVKTKKRKGGKEVTEYDYEPVIAAMNDELPKLNEKLANVSVPVEEELGPEEADETPF